MPFNKCYKLGANSLIGLNKINKIYMEELDNLIFEYKSKISIIISKLKSTRLNNKSRNKLLIKKKCYREFIKDLGIYREGKLYIGSERQKQYQKEIDLYITPEKANEFIEMLNGY